MTPSADLPAMVWRKGSKSTAQGNECVEIASTRGFIFFRDSGRPTEASVTVTRSAFALLAAEVRKGQHDL